LAAITSAGRATGFEALAPAADSVAAAALYERHSSRVFGYCLSRLGAREDAEDAVQTTFLHAVRGLRRGVVPATEIAWLLGIARNVCLSRWESVGSRSRLESLCDPHELDRGSAAPEATRDELIGLEAALRQLPDQQREAVLLRDWRGLSYEEVAAQLGVSHAAVETLIFRGRRTLAELLDESPQATRRRLRSLGGVGSLFAWVKAAFSGSAAVTKIAVAATTAVALSGAGALVAPSLRDGEPRQPRVPHATLAATPAVSFVGLDRLRPAGHDPQPAATTRRVATERTGAKATPTRSATPAPAPAPAASSSPTAQGTPGVETAADPTRATASSEPETSSRPQESQPTPSVAAPPTSAQTTDVVPAVTGAVNETVDTLVPGLPVEVPSLPLPPVQLPEPVNQIVIDVVEAVPAVAEALPVTVELPPSLLPPILVTPPKLLP
jgi:RNA polymerase sigma factor (sigma-70 family)